MSPEVRRLFASGAGDVEIKFIFNVLPEPRVTYRLDNLRRVP